MSQELEITPAGPDHLAQLAPLFDAYRQFYGQGGDEASAKRFLAERLERQDSVILLACRGPDALGFVQLYPSFSSVAIRRIWVLNDLFVDPNARRQGVAERLMRRAIEFARSTGACRLALATGAANLPAQRLYAKLGWTKDEAFVHFNYAL